MIAALVTLCLAGQPCKPPVHVRIERKACIGVAQFTAADPLAGVTRQGQLTIACGK